METRLRNFSYDVKNQPVNVAVEKEPTHRYPEDGKIAITTHVTVSDTVDIKQSTENTDAGKIKPYGLDTDAAYDVEVKEKVEPTVIEEHIDKAVKKETRKKSK